MENNFQIHLKKNKCQINIENKSNGKNSDKSDRVNIGDISIRIDEIKCNRTTTSRVQIIFFMLNKHLKWQIKRLELTAKYEIFNSIRILKPKNKLPELSCWTAHQIWPINKPLDEKLLINLSFAFNPVHHFVFISMLNSMNNLKINIDNDDNITLNKVRSWRLKLTNGWMCLSLIVKLSKLNITLNWICCPTDSGSQTLQVIRELFGKELDQPNAMLNE